MKIYAIAYEQIDGSFSFYVYIDKWLSERQLIDKSFYYQLKRRFSLPSKNNKSFSGMYFTPEI